MVNKRGAILRNFWTGCIVLGVILLLIGLQINLLNEVPLFGVKANIGIVFVATLSILCGQSVGIAIGIVYGMLSDILFGKVFGIYTLLFFLVGFFCGRMSKGFSKENKVSVILITAMTTIIFEVLFYFLYVMLNGYEIELLSLVKVFLLEGVYNMLIARLLFGGLSVLSEMINRGKRSYYLL